MSGSDFGNAIEANTEAKNNAVYSGIDDERRAAIANIVTQGNNEATQEIAAKNAAKQQSAQDYINFLSQQTSRRDTRTQNAAAQAVAAGIDLTNPSSADVKSIASAYNIDPSALVSSYVRVTGALAEDEPEAGILPPTDDLPPVPATPGPERS